jgi:signal transduction histidine kinase
MPRLTEGILAVEAGDARTTSSTLRSLAADLREEVSEGQLAILEWGGIAASLEGAVGAMEAKGLSASLTVQDLGGDPPWPVQIAAWRVAQEALDNALAHASADSIAIVAAIGARQLSIEIADDGVGVDAMTLARARRSGHIGVVSMLDRAREVGALVSIAENRPSGTVIRFRWPR